ncbi:MAG: ABC transporter permease [Actinomycetota bacterium]
MTVLAWILAQSEEPLIRWDWIVDHLDEIGADAVQHVQLVVASVGLAFLIAFPLAVLAHRHRLTYAPITWVTGILYTIPSLAAIAFLIPITGLSLTTVVLPLAGYNLLILIRNNVAGLDTVPDDVKEAARGMGYRDRQSLWRIEVPLAVPVIVAGVRIATVSTIGLATIGGLIGRGGFGQLIFDGLETDFWTPLLLGSFLTVAFALLADLALLGLQRWVTPWAKAPEQRTAAT